MRRFVVGSVSLWATMGLICIISIVAARQFGPPLKEAEALGFGLCGAVPCFMGIQPGVTSWAETRDRVGALAGSHITRSDDQEIDLVFNGKLQVTLPTA